MHRIEVEVVDEASSSWRGRREGQGGGQVGQDSGLRGKRRFVNGQI